MITGENARSPCKAKIIKKATRDRRGERALINEIRGNRCRRGIEFISTAEAGRTAAGRLGRIFTIDPDSASKLVGETGFN